MGRRKIFFSSHWGGDIRTIQYYNDEVNCNQNGNDRQYSADLHNSLYVNHCTNYHAGSDGSNDESLYHVSCLFAWYLYYNFGQGNLNVVLIGHSMGGLIIRETMYQVQDRARLNTGDTFPSSTGHVTNAITIETPHDGVFPLGGILGCGGCTQLSEMSNSGQLIQELAINAQDPQTPGGTLWTLIGSTCDALVPAYQAIDMLGANHAIVYTNAGNNNACYDHGAAVHAPGLVPDASVFHCDESESDIQNYGASCGTNYSYIGTADGIRFSSTLSFPRGLLELVKASSVMP